MNKHKEFYKMKLFYKKIDRMKKNFLTLFIHYLYLK